MKLTKNYSTDKTTRFPGLGCKRMTRGDVQASIT